MSGSPDSVVRAFLASWGQPDRNELARFFAEDAVWVDGPQGVRQGADAIVTELCDQLAVSGGITVDIVTMVTQGNTVMAEWRSEWETLGTMISAPVMAVFEFDHEGKIIHWREAYDLTYVVDQLEAAATQARG